MKRIAMTAKSVDILMQLDNRYRPWLQFGVLFCLEISFSVKLFDLLAFYILAI